MGVNFQDSHIRFLELVSHVTKPKRSFGRNLNLYEWLRLNKKKPFPLEFDITGRLYTVVGDNYQVYIRLVSNEVAKNVPFHYVPEDYKKKNLSHLTYYFRDTPHWNNIVQGIDADFKASYRRRKSKTECLKHSLGERSNHTRGIGRKVKNIAPYYVPSTSTNAQNFNAFAQELTQQFTEQMLQMFLSQNPNTQPPQFQITFDPSRLQVPNVHDVDEEDEENQRYENEDDENEEDDVNEE
ncbi:unnamed protein product [Lactuca saligna]|uniref:Uncharacterized protein n=1 Tax=Lactuca saligna TaxID=75948 RepID=A0AA35YQ72_LACSI|nr:unnamed protein product [Lactuca saligna]